MVAETNERIYMTMSKETVAKVDFYARKMGMTRSALGAYLVAQGILGLEKAQQITEGIQAGLSEIVKEEVKRAIAEKAG